MSRQSTTVDRVCERCKNQFVQVWSGRRPDVVRRFCSIACRNKSRIVPILDRVRRRLGPPIANGCIIWPGGTNGDGRAIIKAEVPRKRMVLVSHILWEDAHGSIPDGAGVLHTCDNPQCVNVAHFFLGTQADNMADMWAKGRANPPRGEQCHSAKLTEEQVRTIRRRIAVGELTQPQAAKEYSLRRETIRSIVIRKTWKHV